MKKPKKLIGGALLEVLGEVLFTLLFFGIGRWIIALFGVNFKNASMDDDWIVLLGVAAFFLVFAIAYCLVRLIKKIMKGKKP